MLKFESLRVDLQDKFFNFDNRKTLTLSQQIKFTVKFTLFKKYKNCFAMMISSSYKLILFFITCISAQASLSTLEQSARQIPDIPCSSQILMTLNEAEEVFRDKGLSQEFIDALEDVQTVAGDKQVADNFRSLLLSSINDYTLQENTISVNASVLKTGPGLPEGFGKSSDAVSTKMFHAFLLPFLLHLFKLF